MDLKRYKENDLLKPEQTIIIDRNVNIDNYEIHILALTYQKNSYSLWVVDCMTEESADDISIINKAKEDNWDTHTQTNRYFLKRNKMNSFRFIKSIEIDKHVFQFNVASSENLYPDNQAYNRLKYFINKGIEITMWTEIPLGILQLTEYNCSEPKPKVESKLFNQEIKINFGSYLEKKYVNYKYRLEYNLVEPIELKYFNSFENREESFFVNNFEAYSLDKYISSIKRHEKYKDVPKDQIDRIVEVMANYFEELKNQNLTLVLMSYESDCILELYSTEYLDRRVDQSSKYNSSSQAFMFKLDDDKGPHGKKQSIASLLVSSKENLSSIEFELHYIIKKYPEESMTI